ncbi:MBL fold metallo-hydrolase [Hyalangium gracile]|uniref:MBL fold metallo-hydrolase n=1 Tax=Hyalangium gracile TaxID=394092 RepID=UPI001CD006D7|nr:MBL fold metallo-hydrolase [Hyalangium gracile]
MKSTKRRGVLGRVARWTGVLLVLALIGTAADAWTALGRGAEGERRARMKGSPQWKDGHFENPQPLMNDLWGSLVALKDASPDVSPREPMPTVAGDAQRFGTPPSSGLRVTWFGHSSVLVEIDGHRVLTDPAWSERVSPLSWIGPRRWYSPLVALGELPSIDAVVISHDHYDHLDHGTIAAMKDWNTTFIVPLGIGAHLASWGVPEARIVELDWWERTRVGGLEIVCTPARHASGRFLTDKDGTLWAGYALIGPRHRAYYSGDTGLFPAMKDIGEKLGPFDVTMIEVGQYHRAWPDWHIGPEQAVRAHQMVRGRVLLPVHWGLFTLAMHGWTEPIERVLAAASSAGQSIIAPKPGQSVEPSAPPAVERWWPEVPWQTAAQHPIVSTQVEP